MTTKVFTLRHIKFPGLFTVIFLLFFIGVSAQTSTEKAEAVIKKAVQRLGGERYLQVKSVIATGNYTTYRGTIADIPVTFSDAILYPDKERTEFKQGGGKFIQVNSGETGWIYDPSSKTLREQNPKEVESFKRTVRTNLDNFLRSVWRGKDAKLSYVGRREASVGKRNDVVKLNYEDGFWIEYEFDANDGLPMKAIYPAANPEIPDAEEEERYAQFVEQQGVYAPFVIDRLIDGKPYSRINYVGIEFDKNLPETVFVKPGNVKDLKKGLKFNR